jgi:hypothetical protein
MSLQGFDPTEFHPLQQWNVTEYLLYHYTSPFTLAKILDSGNLHLGPYSRTNDPREYKEWVPLFTMPSGHGRPPERYLHSSEEAEKAVQEATDRFLRWGTRLACFSTDRPPPEGPYTGTFFHRGWARARMWEQYGSHHTGACLVFSMEELAKLVDQHIQLGNGDILIFDKVTYRDEALIIRLPRPEVVDRGIGAVLDDYVLKKKAVENLYLVKNSDWESEQEFRIVYVKWNASDKGLDNPAPIPFGKSLKWIVLGEHFPETERSVIKYRSGFPAETGILTCEWHSGAPILWEN